MYINAYDMGPLRIFDAAQRKWAIVSSSPSGG